MGSFVDGAVNFRKRVRIQHVEVAKKATELFCLAVINDTPVLEGYLVNNWNLSLGGGHSTDIRPYAAPTKGAPRNRIKQQLKAVDPATIEGDFYFYFDNNMPYAHRIEYEGYSSVKAPQGMLRINAVRWGEFYKQAAKMVKV